MHEFDVIVIGGGSAGCAAAAEVAANPKLSVCLIEAGGDNNNAFVKIPGLIGLIPKRSKYEFDTEPMDGLGGRIGYQPRGRGLGGSSAINGMIYIRGNRWDYDNWEALGCNGWSYDDVLPVFRRQEGNCRGSDEFHGSAGPLTISDLVSPCAISDAMVRSATNLQIPYNHDFNGSSQEGFGPYQANLRNSERWTSARAFLDPVKSQRNIKIETNTLVERLVIENGKATGVQIRRGGNSEVIWARGGIILSGGAFGSPQTLMLSGIGPAAHLAEMGIDVVHNSPAVGADLQDHCDYLSCFELNDLSLVGASVRGFWHLMKAFGEYHRKRDGMLTSNYIESGGFVTLRHDSPAPDVQFHFIRAMLADHGRAKIGPHGFSIHVCVLRPESRGWVKLRSRDAADAPLINPNFLSDPRDLAIMRDGARLMNRIVNTAPLSDYGAKEVLAPDYNDEADLDRRIREVADTVYHPVGTCRMGPGEDDVVDPRLKVRGVENLWVADASIMPRIVTGNTNAPSIMIGGRCGEWVRQALH